MDKMYKVECTEDEVQALGARRWRMRNKRRYLIRSLIALGIALVSAVLACSFTGTPSWVFGFLTVAALLYALFFPYRMDDLATKAGKKFVEALKKGEPEK
jgi:hypothetical protein